MKISGSDEDIIQWAIRECIPARSATSEAIKEHWMCGTDRSRRLTREASRRIAGGKQGQIVQTLKTQAQLHRRGDNELSAEITFHTPLGAKPTLSEAINNPKLQSALTSAEINLPDFEIVKFKSNSWDVSIKLADNTIEQRTNHQFSIEWRRRLGSPILSALEGLLKRLPEKGRPYAKTPKRVGDCMVEIALYDLHFGLLSWAAETGENYDVKIARHIMADATAQILQRTAKRKVEYYLLPIGNDFLHVNNVVGQTPQNRNQLDVDTRLARIIEEGALALRDTVEALAKKAPVEVLWIPGNHDPQTSYYLLRELAAWYKDDGRVTIDTSPKPRKTRLYGINLIGFMHGSDIATGKEKALAGLLADEAADLWAPNQYREIHKGHYHAKGELYFTGASTYGGVVVRTIPSLVGTDYWHFSKGFVGSSKTAQYFVWAKDYGLESVNDVHVDISFYKDNPVLKV